MAIIPAVAGAPWAPSLMTHPLRVALLAPIAWRTPPRHYGPWEAVVSLLAEGLVDRGFDVTLFATLDSVTRGRLAGVVPRGYAEDPSLDPKVWECLHIASVFERAGEFDLIHNHFDFLPLTYSGLVDTPMLTTIHGFSSPDILPVYRRYSGRTSYVAISDADRDPTLTYAATIHHGIDVGRFTFRSAPGEYLLFFGRMHPDKGAAEAIEIARRGGLPLVMAGIIQDAGYFRERVEPHLDGERVTYLGSVGPDRRDGLLGGAFALLHPISFSEPFGLSVVEAMACGTPVIAFERGSMRELIRHERDGFLVRDVSEAVAALARVGALDRRDCRRRVEERFSVARMVDDYVRVYEAIAGRSPREPAAPPSVGDAASPNRG